MSLAETYNLRDWSMRLGTAFDGKPIIYKVDEAQNFSVGVMGQSGSGKTYTIRKMVEFYASRGTTVLVIDSQGDLSDFDNVQSEVIKNEFRYAPGSPSINPLRIDPNPDAGGVQMAIRNFVEIVKLANPALGSRQESDIRALLKSYYDTKGIVQKQPQTWVDIEPKFGELVDHVKSHLDESQSGIPRDAHKKAGAILKKIFRLQDKLDKVETEDKQTKVEAEIDDQTEILHSYWTDVLDKQIHYGRMAGSSFNDARLEGIYDIFSGMRETGIYTGDAMEIRGGRVNVFNIVKLHPSDQTVLFSLLLERVFATAMRNCRELNPKVPNFIVVLDEGKLAAASAKSGMSAVNRISTEGRKYGLGSIIGFQSPHQLERDMLDNFGTFMLLPINSNRHSEAKRLFNLKGDPFFDLKPQSDGLLSFNSKPYVKTHLWR